MNFQKNKSCEKSTTYVNKINKKNTSKLYKNMNNSKVTCLKAFDYMFF